jgi:hypothetical protein
MASQNSTLRAQQLAAAYTRDGAISLRPYQQPVRFAVFDITITTAIASNDDIILGSLGVGGTVIPELSRIVGVSSGGSGNVIGAFTLEKVNEAGTVAAVSGQASIATNGTPVAFARLAAGTVASFAGTDYLQATFTEATAGNVAAGDVIQITLAYISDELV